LPGIPEDAVFDVNSCCTCCSKEKEEDEDDESEEKRLRDEEGAYLSDLPSINEDQELDEEEEEVETIVKNKHRRSRSKELSALTKQMSVRSEGTLKRELDRRDTMADHKEPPKLPSFMTILYLIFWKDLSSFSIRNTKMYFYCIGWKLKCLFKLTFGLWDDDLLRGMQIAYKAELYDEDPEDDTDHHDDMIRLKGKSHALIWQFSTTLLIISKLSEAINESPLFIKPDREEVSVPPICDSPPFPDHYGFIRIGMSWLYRLILGRIARFVFSMVSLVVAVVILLNPDGRFIILYLLFIIPQKVVKMFQNSELIASRFRHVAKILIFYGCVKLADRKRRTSTNNNNENEMVDGEMVPPPPPPSQSSSFKRPKKDQDALFKEARKKASFQDSSENDDLGE